MVDIIVLVLIGIFAIVGFFRGIVSQLLGILGLVAAYFFAPTLAELAAPWIMDLFRGSRFLSEKIAVLGFGILIYISARIFGFFISKLFVNRIAEFKQLNRMGGAILGVGKCVALLAIIFSFISLIPGERLARVSAEIPKSRTFQFAEKYNPILPKERLQKMQKLREAVRTPERRRRLESDPTIRKILSKYKIEGAFRDRRFVAMVRDGDYERMEHHEAIESLMKEDQLTDLLEELDRDDAK